MSTVLSLILLLLVAGACERFRARRARRLLPLRIHVNGTRGKSSVTRLIAAGLRAGGVRVAAKTTGTSPRYIAPDGREEVVARPAGVAIREQGDTLIRAARDGAAGIVIECMALQPETLSVSEDGFIQSTLGVVTNVRPDHLDLMGPTVAEVARNLARTSPRGGICFTAERDPGLRRLLDEACRRRGSSLKVVDRPVPRGWAEGFGYCEHEENVALALAVCAELGVDRRVALGGMQAATPDSGALRVQEIPIATGVFRFASAFAANDPESTILLWERLRETNPASRSIVVIATRADRVERAFQFGDALPLLAADHVLVTGPLSARVLDRIRGADLSSLVIEDLGDAPAEAVWLRIESLAIADALVFGCGNIAGTGARLAAIAATRATDAGRPAA